MTAASPALIGETLSDSVTLVSKIDSPTWAVTAMVVIMIATRSTNTAANIVSPTNAFQNIAPKKINQKRDVLLTSLIGILLMS